MDIANLLSQRNGATQAGNGATKGLPLLAEMEGGEAGEKFDRLLTNFLTLDAGRTAAKAGGDGARQDKAQMGGREQRWGLMGINLLPQTEQAGTPALTSEVAAFLDELSTMMGQTGNLAGALSDDGEGNAEGATGEAAGPDSDDAAIVAAPLPEAVAMPVEAAPLTRFGLPSGGDATEASSLAMSLGMNEDLPTAGTMATPSTPTMAPSRPAPVIPLALPLAGEGPQGGQAGSMMPPMPIIRDFPGSSGRTAGETPAAEWNGATGRGQPGAITLPAGMVPVSDVKAQAMQAVSTLALNAQAGTDIASDAVAVTKSDTLMTAATMAADVSAKQGGATAVTVETPPRQTMVAAGDAVKVDGTAQIADHPAAKGAPVEKQNANGPMANVATPAAPSPAPQPQAGLAPQVAVEKKAGTGTVPSKGIEMVSAGIGTVPSESTEVAPPDDPTAPAASTTPSEMPVKPAPLPGHGPAARAANVPSTAAKADDSAADSVAAAEDFSAQDAVQPSEDETNKRMLAPKHIGREATNAEDGAAQIAGQMVTPFQAPRPAPDMVSMVRTPSVADNLLSRAVAATSGGSGSELSADSHPDAALTTGNGGDLAATSGQALGDTKVQGTDFAQHLRQSTGTGRAGAPPPPPHQIAVQVQRAVQEGQDRLSIQLRPLDLGRIDVQLDFGSEGKLRAKVTADSAQTLELLQKDSKSLERSLQEAGLEMDQGGLSFSLRDPGDQAQRGNDRQQEEGRSGTKTASVQPEDETPASAAYRPVLEPGRVDVRI
ncbi:flagellar hook-length control protein FliK [Niveispirillum irakense]|uniref:flagellar hook-length control protein FliK n=1 Tax=Niveispirillum irakense TaxID=34011 RepID=UPI00040171A3|nr:flagellar hook-length control protein FliK [Niveispirillum irakense]